jgi:hypothetical protein
LNNVSAGIVGDKMTNKPETKFRSGTVCATVWKNKVQTKDGQEKNLSSISFEKSYKDKSGEWKTTKSLNATDLPKAILVLSKAYEHISLADEDVSLEALPITEEA